MIGHPPQFLFFAGNFVGVLASGILADKFGRKITYISFLTLWIGFGLMGSLVKNLYAWMFARFMCGALRDELNSKELLSFGQNVNVWANDMT